MKYLLLALLFSFSAQAAIPSGKYVKIRKSSVSAVYVLGDEEIHLDATSGPLTYTLPTAIGNMGKVLLVRKTDATANTVTVGTTGGQLIEFASTVAIKDAQPALEFVSDNVKWRLRSPNTAPIKAGVTALQARAFVTSTNHSGSFSTTSTPASVAVTNLSVTITTTGRPVFLTLKGGAAGSQCFVGPYRFSSGNVSYSTPIYFYRGATEVSYLEASFFQNVSTFMDLRIPGTAFSHVDEVAAGTYTYTVRTSGGGAAYESHVYNCYLMAYEI